MSGNFRIGIRCLLLTFTIVLIGCSSNKKVSTGSSGQFNQSQSNSEDNAVEENTIFSLQTTPCYGECPVFTFSFGKDSLATLQAEQYILEKGTYKTKLSSEQYKELMDAVFAKDWESMDAIYPAKVSDFPTNYFKVNIEGNYKTVQQEGNVPKELLALKNDLVEIIKRLNWE